MVTSITVQVSFLRSESAWVSSSNDVKLDLETWLHFLANFNRKVMFVPSSWDSPHILTLGSDSSCSWGWAAIFLDQYFALPWPKNIPSTNLALLKLYPFVIATFMWEQKMTKLGHSEAPSICVWGKNGGCEASLRRSATSALPKKVVSKVESLWKSGLLWVNFQSDWAVIVYQ